MNLQEQVARVFKSNFGRTPLNQRLEDILREAIELKRWTDISNLKEELGDLLASSFQAATELGCTVEELVKATLEKVEKRTLQYRSLGRKTSVAILGGAFDPPTKGHMDVARYVLDTSQQFDEVFLMPCNSHMLNKHMTSSEHRLAMCNLAVAADPRVRVFDYEIKNQLSSETYQTVKLLQEEEFAKNKFDFSMIIGMDNANTFSKWVNYEGLERLIRFVVVPRQGVEMDASVSWYLKPPHIFLGNAERKIRQCSSTVARTYLTTPCEELVNLGMQILDLLDPLVLDYIMRNGLYGTGAAKSS